MKSKIFIVLMILILFSASVADAKTIVSSQLVLSEYTDFIANLGYGFTVWSVTYSDGSRDTIYKLGKSLLSGAITGDVGCTSDTGFAANEPFIKSYDANNNGLIEKAEANNAVVEYMAGRITKAQAVMISTFYFGSCAIVNNQVVSPARGTLSITSQPSGAAVYITREGGLVYLSGEMTTPFSMQVSPANYYIVLKKPGYTNWVSGSTPVLSGQTKTIGAGMSLINTVPAPAPTAYNPPAPAPTATPPPATTGTGNIQINSVPSGAQVCVTTPAVGCLQYTTPQIFVGYPAGTFGYTLKRAGYADYHGTVTVIAGSTATVNPTLSLTAAAQTPAPTATAAPRQTSGNLKVDITPAGSTIDAGLGYTQVTPYTFTNLYPGTYTVRVTRAGYTPYQGTLVVQAGSTSIASGTLIPAPAAPTPTPAPAITTVQPGNTPAPAITTVQPGNTPAPRQAPGFSLLFAAAMIIFIAVRRR